MFLTPSQLHELTDRQRPSAQIAWLREHGWRFEVGASGRPKVAAAEFDRHMAGSRSQTTSRQEPRFDALDRVG
jgi:hypothetical protein